MKPYKITNILTGLSLSAELTGIVVMGNGYTSDKTITSGVYAYSWAKPAKSAAEARREANQVTLAFVWALDEHEHVVADLRGRGCVSPSHTHPKTRVNPMFHRMSQNEEALSMVLKSWSGGGKVYPILWS